MGLLKEFSRIFVPDVIEKAVVDPVAALVGENVVASGKSAVSAPAVSRQQAIETPTSGTIQAPAMEYMGASALQAGLAPQQALAPTGFISRLPQIARGVRDIAIGVGIGEAAEAVLDRGGQLKGVTRADQRKAKQMVELVGFDQAAKILGVAQAFLQWF